MNNTTELIENNKKYLGQLSEKYPTIQSVCTEIINLQAILNLPKGTEHFLSDIHGEYEAFTHILNNCSGVVRERVDELFGKTLTELQKSELCTLIYYPSQKLERARVEMKDPDAWVEWALLRLIEVCRFTASKYTRSKVRKAMPPEFSYVIDELLHADYSEQDHSDYYQKILDSIIDLQDADDFIIALAALIKRLAVDWLHIVGDIFDRGPRPDLIMDMLMEHHHVDIQWGNHDILWMGAAAGNAACVASVIVNCAAFGHLRVLEHGYGINLRPLAMFADKTYNQYGKAFATRLQKGDNLSRQEERLAAKIHKAALMLVFKLEGQLVMAHPEYGMENRLLLDKINRADGTVTIGGNVYKLEDTDFPTVDPKEPYRLSDEEESLIRGLVASFGHSERLQRHVQFLYAKGRLYSKVNQNLIFHGCVPMNEEGGFAEVKLCGSAVSGRALMDRVDKVARAAYFDKNAEKSGALDAMWYLWCGSQSPLFGRDRMTTFERRLIADKSSWTELSDPYYKHINQKKYCVQVLEEFGLSGEFSHIINGHVPVRVRKGENPVKGGGKLIVIDGGFCKAYQPKTGIAGYTLIYGSWGMRLSAHMPFESVDQAIAENIDIHSSTNMFETRNRRLKVMDTDIGQDLSARIHDLKLLLAAYRMGEIK